MTNKNKDKEIQNFDAVKFMRKQRNRISKELYGLKPEEIIEYFSKQKKTIFED